MDKIEKVLTRGVEQILPKKKALAELMAKRKIRLYQGFDPSMPSLHLGNLVGLMKLRQFQKLGHEVIFLVGDFTGMIGDPTDKLATRKKLTREQVLGNAKSWKEQAGRVLDFGGTNPAKIFFNSEWLDKVSFKDLIEIASNVTHQQMIERDVYQERIKKGAVIHFHELLYPIAQGYDSVAMDVDLEIGGNDQLFNMLAGRTLIKAMRNKEKFVLTMKLLEDPGGIKMGKTEGNAIFLTDTPSNLFGQIMAFPDTTTKLAIELLTDFPLDNLDKQAPLETKKKLAFDVVRQICGLDSARKAQSAFESTFQKRRPDYNIQIPLKESLATTIAPFTAGKSISEAKRLINQGGVDVNGKTVEASYAVKTGDKIKIGKKFFGTVV